MQKIRESKHFVTIVCLILGAVLLCSAGIANIGNAGGYSAYKKGIIGMLGMSDFSGHGTVLLDVDGVELLRFEYAESLNSAAGVGETKVYSHESMSGPLRGEFSTDTEQWWVVNPDDHITGDTYTYYLYTVDADSWSLESSNYTSAPFASLVDFDPDTEYNSKVMRVAELVVDTFVGDLKNNFIYVGTKDGLKEYRVSLSGNQLPEIVQALMSLAFDNNGLIFAGGTNVMPAVDFDLNSLDVEDGWERYNDARREAWEVVFAHDEGSGVAVINSDLSIDWYPSATDYFATLGKLDIQQMLLNGDVDNLLLAIKGEPKITSAVCDLSVDRDGRLMANTLQGTVEFRLADNTWHSATLTIHGEFDSRDANVVIPLPVVDPMAASIVDHSRACEANQWEFTVSEYGKTETYHRTIEATASGSTDYGSIDWYLGLDPFFKLDHVGEGELSVNPADSTPAGAKVVVYDSGEWVDRDELDKVCEELFGKERCIRDFAATLGVPPYALSCDLLWAYEQLTGEEWDGPLFDFTLVNSTTAPECEYLFSYTPVDRILTLAARCGFEPTLRYGSDGVPADEVFYRVTTRAYSGKTYGSATICVTADELSEAMSVIQRAADADELPYLEEYNLYPDELLKMAYDAYWNSLTIGLVSDIDS